MEEKIEGTPEAAEPKTLDAAVEEVKKTVPQIEMQHVIITLADGRRGVFMGPALVKRIEMELNAVPRLVSVDFDPPKTFSANKPEEKKDESADKPTLPSA